MHDGNQIYWISKRSYIGTSEESDDGISDLRSEESDSSAGSVLERSTYEATRTLAAEWDAIEKLLYGEEGADSRPHIVKECEQWKELVPHLRIVGKKIYIPPKRAASLQSVEEEIIAEHFSDYSKSIESDERLSESSFSDSTPQNSPRARIRIPTASRTYKTVADKPKPVSFREKSAMDYRFRDKSPEPRFKREKSAFSRLNELNEGFNDSFLSMLQITPLYPRSPPKASSRRQWSSVLKSDISSAKWMKKDATDSPKSRNRREKNSAKSFISLDMRYYADTSLSAKERQKIQNEARISTAKPNQNGLQSLHDHKNFNGKSRNSLGNGRVSLPPLNVQEEVNSLKYFSRLGTCRNSRKNIGSRAITGILETEN